MATDGSRDRVAFQDWNDTHGLLVSDTVFHDDLSTLLIGVGCPKSRGPTHLADSKDALAAIPMTEEAPHDALASIIDHEQALVRAILTPPPCFAQDL